MRWGFGKCHGKSSHFHCKTQYFLKTKSHFPNVVVCVRHAANSGVRQVAVFGPESRLISSHLISPAAGAPARTPFRIRTATPPSTLTLHRSML